MRSRLAIQIALAAAIILLWLYISRHGSEEPDAPGPFDALEPEEVAALVWVAQDGTRRIERDGVGWTFRAGSSSRPRWRRDRANERLVTELLRSLPRMRAERVLEPGGSLEAYGLDPPLAGLAAVSITDRAESLWVGARAPVGRGRYAFWRAIRPRIAVLDDYIVEQFVLVEDERLRDPHLGRLPLGDLDTAAVSMPGESFRLERDGSDWWVRAGTGRHRADTLACRKAAGTLLRLRAIRFFHAPGDPEPAELGLDAPRARWLLVRAGERDTFRIAERDVSQGRMVVWANHRPPALVLDEGWELLVGGVEAFRDRDLFAGAGRDWTEVVFLAREGPSLRLRRDAGGWQAEGRSPTLGGPDPRLLLQTAVENLARLRIAEFAEPARGSPDLVIVAAGEARADTVRVWRTTGGITARSSHQPETWARVEAQDLALWWRLLQEP